MQILSRSAAKMPGVHRRAVEETLSTVAKSGLNIIVNELETMGNYGELIDEEALTSCLRQFFGDSATKILVSYMKIRNAELNKEIKTE